MCAVTDFTHRRIDTVGVMADAVIALSLQSLRLFLQMATPNKT